MDFLVQWITIVAHETGLGGCCLIGKLQDNAGPHKSCIFNPFSALLSNEFVTKTVTSFLIMWLHDH